MSQISLATCRWINKAHSSTWIYFYSTRGTKTAKVEGQWPPSNWLKYSVPKTQMTAWRFVHAFLIYHPPKCMSKHCDITKWCHDHLLPLFHQEKHCACTGELPWFICTPAGVPADYFLPLYLNHVVFSITQILSLWHSPLGISVCPHSRASNLLLEYDMYSQLTKRHM